jgi:hypothetical protein
MAARHWRGLVAVLVGLLLAVVLLRPDGIAAERRALLGMAPVERRTLFDETRRNAEALCAQAQSQPALLDRCLDSTAFLLAFPECDEACRAFGRAHRRLPTR